MKLRRDVRVEDRESVREIVESTGFFHGYEVDVAVELVDERLSKGESSGYFFIFAESEGSTVGYACYGPIACTESSYDLYWIAVHERMRGRGLGKSLLAESERLIAETGGRQIYVETSSRDQYKPTRAFYLSCGYEEAARLTDFYAPGDDKVVYVKRVAPVGQ